MARFLYFAWVRERIGVGREELSLPVETTVVSEALEFLRARGENYREALAGGHLRVAVNQTHAAPGDPVSDADEIAIFPPVSGG